MREELRLFGGPIDPNLEALEDAVRSIRDVRSAAWAYQDPDVEAEVDAPSGVLEGLLRAESELVEVVSTLASNLAIEQYANIERPE